MVAIFGAHVLKHSSNIQSTIALSTGESEYYALVKGGPVGLGLQSLCADLGLDLEVAIEGDSNAAKGAVDRVGLGKARRIQTRYLWLQERVAEGHLKVHHVPGVKISPWGAASKDDGRFAVYLPRQKKQGTARCFGVRSLAKLHYRS